MERAKEYTGLLLSSEPTSDISYVWECLAARCPHRSTFAVSDAVICYENAHKHARRTDHRVRVTSTLVTRSEHWRADTDPEVIAAAHDAS